VECSIHFFELARFAGGVRVWSLSSGEVAVDWKTNGAFSSFHEFLFVVADTQLIVLVRGLSTVFVEFLPVRWFARSCRIYRSPNKKAVPVTLFAFLRLTGVFQDLDSRDQPRWTTRTPAHFRCACKGYFAADVNTSRICLV
jgi:hypothetical protein